MITLSNGHSFEYMVASGALAFDGKGWWPIERPLFYVNVIDPRLFTTVPKTLTRQPVVGNWVWWHPWTCVRFIPGVPGGIVNKVGLTNPGIDYWCEKIGPKLNFHKYHLAVSLYGNEKDLAEMAVMLNKFKLAAIEVNASCPNTDHRCGAEEAIAQVKAVKANSRHPVIVKLGVGQDYRAIARALVGTAEAVALNSVPWELVYPGKESPLHRLEKKVGHGGGGVSGKPAQERNWKAAALLCADRTLPVIGPSIMSEGDLFTVRNLGVGAVSFGSIHITSPAAPTRIVRKRMRIDECYRRYQEMEKRAW